MSLELAFNSVSDFLSMNGHGSYVWSAWAICVFMLVALIVSSVLQRQKVQKQLQTQARKQRTRQEKINS